MSGAEAIVVLGLISSIISIVDGTKKVYDAATNAQGLPEAFREVAGRLPIVSNILGSAKQQFDRGQVDEDSCKGVKSIVGACEKKAKKLDELFHEAIPADNVSDLKRYYKAVKACGKGNEVENLMKGMLEDVQLLACEHGMKTATKAQQDQIAQALKEVSAVAPSVPENLFQEAGITANYSGSGAQYIAHGEFIAQGEARQYNSAGGSMHFDFHYGTSTSIPSDAKITSQSLPHATPAFFGRESELKAIEDYLLSKDPGQKVVALTGIGGFGKTQIALHFWSMHTISYRSRIWIDATSPATVLTSFREVALALGSNVVWDRNDIASKQPMMAVKSWLALADNTTWLLVIDNVEDLNWDYNLRDVIPNCDHGTILVTTTQSETASVLGALNIEVGAIGKDAGASILRRRFKRKTCTDEEKKLTDNVIEALHGVPLAIEQAGAYLQFNPSLTTTVLKRFLTKLSSQSTETEILAKIPKRSMWFYEKHRSVIDTFSLLKATLAQNNHDALNILLISSFLAQGEIHLSFLTQTNTSDGPSSAVSRMRAIYKAQQKTPSEAFIWLQRITADDTNYYQALETLEQFCCIKRRLAQDESRYLGYSMHNVIRHWCQLNSSSAEQTEWTIMAGFQLSQCLQLDNVSVFSHHNYSRHVSHVNRFLVDPKYASLIRYPDGPYWRQAFMTSCVWARFYQRQRQFYLAHRMIEVVILYEKSAYDSQWPSQRESLDTLHLQATILWEEGDFPKAIQRYKDLLQASETYLGHFDDLTIKASQELRSVQDHAKRYQRNWQIFSCSVEPDSPSQHKEEPISSGGETLALKQFMLRYSDPILPTDQTNTIIANDFHKAVFWGYEDEVRLLLKMVDINVKNSNGATALIGAAARGYETIVRLLLENGADTEAKGYGGATALILAATDGFEVIPKLLLDNDANIEPAAKIGNKVVIIRLLLVYKADVNVKDGSGMTALDYAEEAAQLHKGEARKKCKTIARMLRRAAGRGIMSYLSILSASSIRPRSTM